MNNIHNKMEEIKREFSIFEDSREKYIYLVDIAKKSSGISPNERNDDNKVCLLYTSPSHRDKRQSSRPSYA